MSPWCFNVHIINGIQDFKLVVNHLKGAPVGKAPSARDLRIRQFNEFVKVYQKHSNTLFKKKQTCPKKLNQLRSAALCGTCSGRSEVFFLHDKAKMKFSKCLEVINVCHDYWQSLLLIFEALAKINHLVVRKQQTYKLVKTEQSDFKAKWLQMNKISQSLQNCTSSKFSVIEQAALICSSLVSLTGNHDFLAESAGFVQ